MEEIKEKKVKSKTSAKSKNANSVKTVSKKETEEKIKKAVSTKKVDATKSKQIKVDETDNKLKKENGEKKKNTDKPAETKKTKAKCTSTNKQKKVEQPVSKEKATKKPENKKQPKATKKVPKEKEQIKVEELELDLDEEAEELEVEEINIEQIQKEIEQHNKISLAEKIKIKRKIIPNIVIALILTAFYIFIELGFKNIETINYIVDLKVFSGMFLAIAIYLFEKAYKTEDSGKSLYGIEMLITSIFNFALVYIYYAQFTRYEIIVFAFAIFTAVYYIIKSIILYIKKKKEYFFEKSDIKEITSK